MELSAGGSVGTVPDVAVLSDVLGQTVSPYEVAYFNGGAVLDDIPVQSRETTDQVVFREPISSSYYSAITRPTTKTMDVNRYATKKTIAQGMLDVALLTANASQLKYVLQQGDNHPFYTLMLTLIVISIIFQVLVGILFLVIGGMSINEHPNHRTANILNDVIVVLIFIITVVNIIISGFGIRAQDIPPSKIPNT